MNDSSDGAPFLRVEDLVVKFNGIPIIQGISLRIWTKEIVAIIGPNGAGKTVFLKSIAGLIKPDGGEDFPQR